MRRSVRSISLFLLLVFLLPAVAGCSRQGDETAAAVSPSPAPTQVAEDPHSFSRPNEVAVKHLRLDLSVNFAAKTLEGTATLLLDNKAKADKLYLDTRGLKIKQVTLDNEKEPAKFSLGEEKTFLGRPLIVDITPQTAQVTVEYATSPDAAALQWLEPQQTAGKKHPFLYSQSQAILARTWVPIQDTPGVRFTYEARIQAPKDLLALMSAENPTEKALDGIYAFRMSHPIPSYLLALAVGDLEFRALGPRSGVYAEPSVAKKAAWEFAETPKMIEIAEKLYGPYRWGRYDILVLPPSFPFGGMENPRLTFATPTVLAGDRSLVSLVAHELAHSWSGNLVTNATWNDFWLNEGFTTYFEQRIMEALYGRDYSEMLAVLKLGELRQTMAGLPAADTALHLNLAGHDPDEAANDVAYEKGYFFLRMMEEAAGRERWDNFLRKYFDTFAFRSMDTAGFLAYMKSQLGITPEQAKQLHIEEWVYGAGLPANLPEVHSARLEKVTEQVQAFEQGTPPAELKTEGWSTHEWLYFLRHLKQPLSGKEMAELDRTFHLTQSGNSEILAQWLEQAIAGSYKPAYQRLEQFLTSVGRRKFLLPLYREMVKTAEGRERALRIYGKARPQYHSVSRHTIDQIVGYQQGAAAGR